MTTTFALPESAATIPERPAGDAPAAPRAWAPLLVPAAPAEPQVPEAGQARRILAAAGEILAQGELLLGALGAELYARKLPVAFNASIGGHYRHCLDHFSSLLAGLDGALVDHDRRGRDPRLEQEPAFALALTRRLRGELARLDPGSLATPVSARCQVSYAPGDSPLTRSTFGRELVYAIAHSIHHYALISVMARIMEAELPPHFGVAPSTVSHQQANGGR